MSMRRMHPVPVIAGLALAALTVSLGNWQMSRADEKRELQKQIEAGAAAQPVSISAGARVHDWMPVELAGRWQVEASIFLDNRVQDGRVGYHVLTPIELGHGAGWVLVNRGWIAAGATRNMLPEVPAPQDGAAVIGAVRVPEAAPFTLAAQAGEGALWQYIDLAQYREWSGLPVHDWIVQQTSPTADGLVRDWPRPDAGIDRHRGYALQWYSFAGLSLALTGFYAFRTLKPHAA
ncbi:SURF1 family protein [Azoarcus taiwanensis]|uniref:SURF1-like protein n=1 Tax=Azoarcus taiwanensis TaxID=666964 RepID=A0A972FCZ6_9RHOO|nr:SURF1 family protein [Azoarcus taiwanensis]NMG03017.1 SURF1 family protein [Azoarcus taiwanensis]